MSLDLSNKAGRTAAFIDGSAGGDFSTISAASFTEGDLADAGQFVLYYKQAGDTDVTAGSPDAFPTSMTLPLGDEAFIDGVRLTALKINGDPGKLLFKDPKSGVTYSFLDRQGESMTFVMDTSSGTPTWVAEV